MHTSTMVILQHRSSSSSQEDAGENNKSGPSFSTQRESIINSNRLRNQHNEGQKSVQSTIPHQNLQNYNAISQQLKKDFYIRYGGKELATQMLQKGIRKFDKKAGGGDDLIGIHHTTGRILYSIATSQPFVMAFGGYSVTVGRGNYFSQSFPFVLQSLLQDAMEKLGVPNFEVRNAAIGGIPSFPYGWCLGNFLGEDVSVVSWDFSMNEGKSAEGEFL
jgi:hypothetical protein